jgi:hypothetical protein
VTLDEGGLLAMERSDQEQDQTNSSPAPVDAGLCPRCAALEARIAELERRLAGTGSPEPARADSTAAPTFPLELKALRVVAPEGWGGGWSLRPSPQRRHWMNENPNAYHCLPLVMANQWGWQVLCPTDVRVTWDGSLGVSGLTVAVNPRFAATIKSQFGSGIVTFSVPWLFRTPPGWDLYVKGPSNRWKANCAALEGVVETWWLNYTFTLNWKIVEPGTVGFAAGESLAQLVPVPHATFDDSRAMEAPLGLAEPLAAEELLKWRQARRDIAGQALNVHSLYRRAEGVEGHLRQLPVSRVEPYRPEVSDRATDDTGTPI